MGGGNGNGDLNNTNSLGSFPGARPAEGSAKSQQRSSFPSVVSDSFGGRDLQMSRTHVSQTFAGSETGPGGAGDSSSQEMTSPQLSWEQVRAREGSRGTEEGWKGVWKGA